MTLSINRVAEIAHEANRALCAAFGDHSHKPWSEAPGWQKDSAIKGVAFLLNNPKAGPEASHESWLAEKERTGWKYGPEKDPINKEHPCMVPYAELPAEQRAKDHVFRSVVLACYCMEP